MRVWTFVWVALVLVLSLFSFLNWQVLTTMSTIDLAFARVTAPLGLTLLATIVGVSVLFLTFVVWLETKAIVELGRAHRPITSPPEASALSDLRADIVRSLAELRSESAESAQRVADRLEQLRRAMTEPSARPTVPLKGGF